MLDCLPLFQLYCFTTNIYPKLTCHHLDTVHRPYLSLSLDPFLPYSYQLSIHIISILFWKKKARKQSKLFKHFFLTF